MATTLPPDSSVSRKRAAARAVVIVVALIALFFLLRPIVGGGRVEEPDPVAAASGATSGYAAGSATDVPLNIPNATPEQMARLRAIARTQKALDDYVSGALYPVSSRPHDDGTTYKLNWNEPAVSILPLSDDENKPTSYRFVSDKAHVGFGEALTSWIEAWEGSDPNKRVPLKISEAYVIFDSGPKQGPAVPLVYNDDGLEGDVKSGDRRYTNRFVPSSIPALRQSQQVHLAAVIEFNGSRRMIIREFTYSPREVIKVLSVADSKGTDGSLTVSLSVDVKEKGLHSFEVNVMSGDGQTPIGWVEESRQLDVGAAVVDLKVFGKIFHEKGIDGPYLVRDIRGFIRILDGSEHNVWWHHDPTHLTKAYRTIDFSDKEWDAPEKTEKIGHMKKMIGDLKSGAIGGTSASGTSIVDNPPPAASK